MFNVLLKLIDFCYLILSLKVTDIFDVEVAFCEMFNQKQPLWSCIQN